MGFLPHLWGWLEVHTGLTNGSGLYYLFWSGIFSCATIFTAFMVWIRGLNCHTPGCKRMSHHTTPKGYKLCKRCISKPESELHLHPIHEHHRST